MARIRFTLAERRERLWSFLKILPAFYLPLPSTKGRRVRAPGLRLLAMAGALGFVFLLLGRPMLALVVPVLIIAGATAQGAALVTLEDVWEPVIRGSRVARFAFPLVLVSIYAGALSLVVFALW